MKIHDNNLCIKNQNSLKIILIEIIAIKKQKNKKFEGDIETQGK